jgi:hypothetical protein
LVSLVPDIDDSYSRQARINWPAVYAGENVVWRGKPVRSKYATKDAKLTLGGIPVAVFMIFWMSMALRIPKKDGAVAWLFPAFGLLFVLQALYLLVGHYLRNWLEWANIEYAVTNRRTVIRRGLWRVSEMSRPHSDPRLRSAPAPTARSATSFFRLAANPTSKASGSN